MTATLFGIPNCDTVKKARRWLDAQGVSYTFHDYKKAGVPAALHDWIARAGWEAVLNRSGTTFRQVPDAEKAALDATRAEAIMRAYPSSIRRPIMVMGERLEIGFSPERYATLV